MQNTAKLFPCRDWVKTASNFRRDTINLFLNFSPRPLITFRLIWIHKSTSGQPDSIGQIIQHLFFLLQASNGAQYCPSSPFSRPKCIKFHISSALAEIAFFLSSDFNFIANTISFSTCGASGVRQSRDWVLGEKCISLNFKDFYYSN